MKALHKEQWSALESAARKSDMELARLNALLTAEQAKVAELAGALKEALPFLAAYTSYSPEATDAYNTAWKVLLRAGGAR